MLQAAPRDLVNLFGSELACADVIGNQIVDSHEDRKTLLNGQLDAAAG